MGAAEASWTRGLVERHRAYVRSTVDKMVHDGVMSAQSLFDKATSGKEHDEQDSRVLSVTMGACHATEYPIVSHG